MATGMTPNSSPRGRFQRDHQQKLGRQGEEASNTIKGEVPLHAVQGTSDDGGDGAEDQLREGEHPKCGGGHTLSYDVHGGGGEDRLVAVQKKLAL